MHSQQTQHPSHPSPHPFRPSRARARNSALLFQPSFGQPSPPLSLARLYTPPHQRQSPPKPRTAPLHLERKHRPFRHFSCPPLLRTSDAMQRRPSLPTGAPGSPPSLSRRPSSPSNMRRTPSQQHHHPPPQTTSLSLPFSRPLAGGATTAVCTAPSPSLRSVAPLAGSDLGGFSPINTVAPTRPRVTEQSSSSRSQPIPISPTSTPPRPASRGYGQGGRAGVGGYVAAERERERLATAGGMGREARETTLAYAIRTGDAALLSRAREAQGGGRNGTNQCSDGSGSISENDGSEESFNVPIVDTRTRRESFVSGGGTSAGYSRAQQQSGGGGSTVGGVRYTNGRRVSSLATYAGLPQPPMLSQPPRQYRQAGGSDDLRYSLEGLRISGGGGAPLQRRASVAGIGAGETPRRPPSPAGNALRAVQPLSPTTAPSASFSRRPSSPSGSGRLHRPTPRRASSPVGTRPSVANFAPTLSSISSAAREGSAVASWTPSSGGGDAPSSAGYGSSARRAPSPAGGSRSSHAAGGGISSGARPPSPSSSSARPPPRPRASGLVRAASPSLDAPPRIVRGFDAPSPSSYSSSAVVHSRSRSDSQSGGSVRSPSPARAPLPPHYAQNASILARARSTSNDAARSASSGMSSSTYPPSTPSVPPAHSPAYSSHPTHSHSHSGHTPTTTRPRSRLADPSADQNLELAASRDFATLDEYYMRRRREARGRVGARVEGGGGTGEGGGEAARREEERRARREAEERLRRGYDRLS